MTISIEYFAARRPLIEGPGDIDSGAWPITWFRVAKGWGMLPHDFWPDKSVEESVATAERSAELDNIAKLDRLTHYQRLRSELACLYAVTAERMASVSLEITKAWRDAPRGQIPIDGDSLPVAAVHCIPLLDFDFESNSFIFPNSWGREWGDKGFGSLPFGYLNRFMVEGWTAPFRPAGVQPTHPGIDLRIWQGEPSKLGVPWIVDILDGDRNVMVAWAHVLQSRTCFDVEELFVRPDYRRKGYGSALVKEIRKAASDKLPVRFWIPWGDHSEPNQHSLIGWAKRVGLKLMPARVRWCAYRAEFGKPVELLPELEWSPPKPTSPLTLLMEPEEARASEWVAREGDKAEAWNDEKATRRAELVQKKYEKSLSAAEQAEFEKLQQEFGQYQDLVAPLPSE